MYKSFKKCLNLLLPYTYIDVKSQLATILTFVLVALQAMGGAYAPKFLGRLVADHSSLLPSAILGLIALIVLCWAAQFIMDYVLSIIFYTVTNRAIRDIRLRVILHLGKADIRNANNYTNAEVMNANERVPLAIVQFMNSIFIYLLPCLLNIVTISIAMAGLFPEGLMIASTLLLSLVPVFFLLKPYIHTRCLVWDKGDIVRNSQTESLQNKVSFRMNSRTETQRVSKAFLEEAVAWTQNIKYKYFIYIIQEAVYLFFAGVVTFYCFLKIKSGSITLSTFVTMNGYMFYMHRNLGFFIKSIEAILSSIVDLSKIQEVLSIPVNESSFSWNKGIEKTPTGKDPLLALTDICFSHEAASKQVITKLNLEINRGDKLAIIGPSGVGKSTLCKIIAGLHKPSSGSVRLYGQNISDLSNELIGQRVKLISQDCSIHVGTIGENLYLYGKNIPEVIYNYFASRLNEKVGDSGRNLSNGERQRILIARALSQKPEVLILDESFSAIDYEASNEILRSVLAVVQTVILVTHNKDLLPKFNRVLDLNEKFFKNSGAK